MAQLNKRLDLPKFDAATRFLADAAIDLRVFVLLGAPHVPAEESVEWTVRTVEHAASVRRGGGVDHPGSRRQWRDGAARALGDFTPPTLSQLEAALDASLSLGGTVVTADLWDVERLPACDACRTRRIERLARVNLRASRAGIACDAARAVLDRSLVGMTWCCARSG